MTDKISRSVQEIWALAAAIVAAVILGLLLLKTAKEKAFVAQAEQFAYETLAANPNPVVVCRNDLIVIFNHAAEHMFGISADSVIGHKATDVLVDNNYKQAHITAVSKLQNLPIGSEGYAGYLMPFDSGKVVVTIQYRKLDNGDLLTIARFINYLMTTNRQWTDMETGKKYYIITEFKPVE